MQQFYSMRCDATTSFVPTSDLPLADGALPLEQWRWSREVLCALAAVTVRLLVGLLVHVYIYTYTYESVCRLSVKRTRFLSFRPE